MTERSSTILHNDGLSEAALESATEAFWETFEAIEVEDRKLPDPIVNRTIGVAVILKPNYEGPNDTDAILAAVQFGEIDEPQPFETFALKAISRAFGQRAQGLLTDTAPAQQLNRLDYLRNKDRLYEVAGASAVGLHAGLAGPWAHHSRLLAATLVVDLAASLEPSFVQTETPPYNPQAEAERLAWLNQGPDSGDNTPRHVQEREQHRPILWAFNGYSENSA